MLFRITNESVFEDNPHLHTMSGFKGITEPQFRFVAFYADWLSPYRNLTKEERVIRCSERAGEDIDPESVKRYIDHYYDIQGIKHMRRSVDALDAGCRKAMDKLMDESVDDADELKKYSATLATLTAQRFEFIKKLNEHMNVTESEIVGEDLLSTADEVNIQ